MNELRNLVKEKKWKRKKIGNEKCERRKSVKKRKYMYGDIKN
jgi:hypothetical protein